jgi:hypothetical protein
MVDYTKPLDDARLEAVAQIYNAWWNEPHNIAACRKSATDYPDRALGYLAEARRQTGADEMAAALRQIAETHIGDCPEAKGHLSDFEWARDCYNQMRSVARAALAAYERIAK